MSKLCRFCPVFHLLLLCQCFQGGVKTAYCLMFEYIYVYIKVCLIGRLDMTVCNLLATLIVGVFVSVSPGCYADRRCVC